MGTIVRGTAARESIGAWSADGDTVIGGQGNDYLLAGPGPDVFAFNPGDGQDWLADFRVGVDKLQFGGGLTAANLSYMNLTVEGVPGLAVIYGGEPNFVFLAGATATSLPPTDLIFAPLPTAPAVRVSSDFNADGMADILWRSDSGQAAVWFMNGAQHVAGAPVEPSPGPNLQVRASGDFNADGRADILVQDASGQAAVWLMDGARVVGNALLEPNPGPSWHLV